MSSLMTKRQDDSLQKFYCICMSLQQSSAHRIFIFTVILMYMGGITHFRSRRGTPKRILSIGGTSFIHRKKEIDN
jgi:hypothetical protein